MEKHTLWYVEKKAPFILCLVDKKHPPKMQSLSKAHLLIVCGGEMEEEILTAVGKQCALSSTPVRLLPPSSSKAGTSSIGHSPLRVPVRAIFNTKEKNCSSSI